MFDNTNPCPELVLRFCSIEEGGVAIVSKGVGVGPGSAAHSTSSTRRRESIEIGTFSGGQYCCCHLFIPADGPCLHRFGHQACQKATVVFRDFLFARQQNTMTTPFINGRLILDGLPISDYFVRCGSFKSGSAKTN